MRLLALLAIPLLASCQGPMKEAHAGVLRGPTSLPVDGDPNGLTWDAGTGTLYVADQAGNQILRWTDAGGFQAAVPLPAAPAGQTELGGLALLLDGRLVTPRFGFGTSGNLLFTTPDGPATSATGLDATRRRLGVTAAADGTLLDGYFVKQGSGRVGSVAVVTLDGLAAVESDVIPGLGKPVGVATIGKDVYASDQDRGQIVHVLLPSGTPDVYVQSIDGPDLLTAGPDGSLFCGSTTGVVYRILAGGQVTTFQGGFQSTRGVAYDAANRRLFVGEHLTTGTTHAVHILPVD
jgi:sugar lactone lactonase YvrE